MHIIYVHTNEIQNAIQLNVKLHLIKTDYCFIMLFAPLIFTDLPKSVKYEYVYMMYTETVIENIKVMKKRKMK